MSWYDGHEESCDCAVCEDMMLRRVRWQRELDEVETIKRVAYKIGYEEGRKFERHAIAQKLNGNVNDGITTAIYGAE